ncbi:glutathione s-transferase [Halocaridina rubra]|uniref:Glutathione s-transferase n=1 Tax=Halocaridina rubra TaxID=373956 RepID=A0AAN8WTU0_HALRR
MSVTVYYLPFSPPCRSVLLTARALGVKVELKELNVLKGEQKTPQFIAINPEHTIPTLVDGDFVLWESRPICSYLASQYAKDDTYYPLDPKIRAKIDRLMYFDMGTLYDRFLKYFIPVMFGGQKQFDPQQLEKVHEALGFLNKAIEGHTWAVGNHITVADHVLASTVATIDAIKIDLKRHPSVAAWYENCKKSMPGHKEINEIPAQNMAAMIQSKLE